MFSSFSVIEYGHRTIVICGHLPLLQVSKTIDRLSGDALVMELD